MLSQGRLKSLTGSQPFASRVSKTSPRKSIPAKAKRIPDHPHRRLSDRRAQAALLEGGRHSTPWPLTDERTENRVVAQGCLAGADDGLEGLRVELETGRHLVELFLQLRSGILE